MDGEGATSSARSRKGGAGTAEPSSEPPRRCATERLFTKALQPLYFIVAVVLELGLAMGGVAATELGKGYAATFFYLAALLAMLFVLSWMVLTKVTIGADGLHLRWLGRGRYIPYEEIETVSYETPALPGRWPTHYATIQLCSGERLTMPGSRESVDRIIGRANEAKAAHDRAERPAADDVQLLRAEGAAEARLSKLRRLGSGAAAGPRTAAVHRDRLWRVVDSPAAADADRAAAAVALAAEISEPDRQRIRVAAESTANPALRVLLTQAAEEGEEDDAALAEALVALESTRRRQR
jgi:hypothetical protein